MAEVIQFSALPKRPAKKQAAAPAPNEEKARPADVFAAALQDCDSYNDVVILTRRDNGEIGLFGNLVRPADILLFLKQLEHKLVQQSMAVAPKGTA